MDDYDSYRLQMALDAAKKALETIYAMPNPKPDTGAQYEALIGLSEISAALAYPDSIIREELEAGNG